MNQAIEVWPVVLAGGSGTRLWPLSRMEYPKQLLQLRGSSSLLQETVLRLAQLNARAEGEVPVEIGEIILVCNAEHRYFLEQQIDTLEAKPGRGERFILEPAGRNTAPALTCAALLAAGAGSDPVMLVLAADHFIRDVRAFHDSVRTGARLAAAGGVGTFGIVPTHAETGYGYIRCGSARTDGAFDVEAFVEKPDAATAQSYIDSGKYLWNSGMFVTRASTWIQAIERFRPDVLRACKAAIEHGALAGREVALDAEAFAACPSDSIDYAVMEPLASAGPDAQGAFVVPLEAGWSDVGSWNSLLEVGERDVDGNVIAGDVFHHATRDTLVMSHHRFVAALGLNGAIIVETPDAVLVADRENAQDVRHIVAWLNDEKRSEARTHRRVYGPWGSFELLDEDCASQVVRMSVKPETDLAPRSALRHREQWLVVRGQARAEVSGEQHLLGPGDSMTIAEGVTHALANPGRGELEVIVVRQGERIRDGAAWVMRGG